MVLQTSERASDTDCAFFSVVFDHCSIGLYGFQAPAAVADGFTWSCGKRELIELEDGGALAATGVYYPHKQRLGRSHGRSDDVVAQLGYG